MSDERSPADSAQRPTANTVQDGPLSPAGVAALKFAVIAMGVLIFVGLAVVVGRIIYLASKPKASTQTTNARAPLAEAKVDLPSGAVTQSVDLDGNRLSILYRLREAREIIIVDLADGRVISRIKLESSGTSKAGD